MRIVLAMVTLGVAMLLALPAALAQGGNLPPLGELSERYAPTADISGTPIVGLVSPTGTVTQGNTIVARIPAAWAGGVICANMVSSDGRYDAERSFQVPPNWTSSVASLEFPTRFNTELNGLRAMELGVMVSLGECTSTGGTTEMVPAAWNSAALGEEATLLVNSFRADETYVLIGALGLDIGCSPLPSDRRTAFDTVCVLPRSVFEAGGRVEVELNRIRSGTLMSGEIFAIDLR